MKLKKIDDGVDIGELLFVRNRARLTKESREFESLAHRGLRLVDVNLLDVAGRPLERDRESLPVDEHLPSDFSRVLQAATRAKREELSASLRE